MTEVQQPVADSTPATPPWGWITSGIAIAAILIMGAILWRTKVNVPATPAASPMQITALTTTRDSSLPALSHDGRFVAYVRTETSRASSLWVRQLAGDSSVKIVTSIARHLDPGRRCHARQPRDRLRERCGQRLVEARAVARAAARWSKRASSSIE